MHYIRPVTIYNIRILIFSTGLNDTMILELAILNVRSGQESDFERAFSKAQTIITSMPGYISHQLQQSLDKKNRYVLLVHWQTVEHHTQGFRQSKEYLEWKSLLHHFYDPFPEIEHYSVVYEH